TNATPETSNNAEARARKEQSARRDRSYGKVLNGSVRSYLGLPRADAGTEHRARVVCRGFRCPCGSVRRRYARRRRVYSTRSRTRSGIPDNQAAIAERFSGANESALTARLLYPDGDCGHASDAG